MVNEVLFEGRLRRMGGSNQRRIRSEISVKVSDDDDDEDLGTAARTRPLSLDEIMHRRKSRKVLEDSNNGEGKVGKETTLYDGGRSVLDNYSSHSKDTVLNDMTTETNDARKASYRRKEEKASKREFNNARSKNKDYQGLEIKSEQKGEKDMRHKTVEKGKKDMHHRSNEKREKDMHQRSSDKMEKDKHHRPNEKMEKDKRLRSSGKMEKDLRLRSDEKMEKDMRHHSNEKMEKDMSYRSSQKTERDKIHRSKQNSQKDFGYKSHNGGQDYARARPHECFRNISDDHEKKHHRDYPTSKDRTVDRDGVAPEREYKRKDSSGNDVKHTDKSVMKKHDSGKRPVSEISERKEKLDSSTSLHEEARSKRRRSKSPEHSKDRGRRSGSFSPRVRKGDELHLDKDRSSKHHVDADRNRVSNGSSGLYQRHGGSSSGLGGYSPRKRKTDAAVKTPSPPKRSPEKRSAGWDRPPSGAFGMPTTAPSVSQIFAQTKPSILVESAGVILATSNASMSLSGLPSSNVSAATNASIDSVQLTQATRPMRRLYVDNVPPSASEKDIMECFNTFLLSSGANHIQGTKPCINCMIHKEKGQALVEFLTPEDASAALSFDSRSFSGSSFKVRRPKDFVELANDFPEKSKAGAETISDAVKDSPHKIFVGGVSDALSSEMLLEIVCAFGPLKAFHFEINENLKEPCAFLEYVDHSVTVKACAALNGMKLGGRVLTVSQAFPDALLGEPSEDLATYGIPHHVKPLLEKPTEVLKIKNALDPKAIKLLSEMELEEILEDVRQECTRFGSVKSINVVKTVDATVPETQEATHLAGSPRTSEEMALAEQSSKIESGVGPDVDVKMSYKMESHNIDESIGGSITERKPKEERQDDAPVADLTTDLEAVDHPGHVEKVKKSDVKTEATESNGDKSASSQATMSVMSEDIENKVGTDDSTVILPEKIDEETPTDIQLELHENKVPDSDEEGTHLKPGDVDKTNGEWQEQAVPLSNDTPGTKVNTNELSETGEKVNADHVFEAGCIFVEFRRPEASCMAAHCLHGRLFDGRVVTIEYVPHSLYSTRFSK